MMRRLPPAAGLLVLALLVAGVIGTVGLGRYLVGDARLVVMVERPETRALIAAADLSGDGRVDALDIAVWIRHYRAERRVAGLGIAGDLNGDGIVDAQDLAMVLRMVGRRVVTG